MPSRAFWVMSGSGLVPLLVCLTLAYAVPDLRDAAVRTFLVYSALTLSFLGGARWGAELVRAPAAPNLPRLGAAAAPSVLGLFALVPQTPPTVAIGLLLLSSGAQLAWDVAGARAGLLPPWNGRVRTVMTALGTLCTLALWPVAG
ncbi:MAG: DUF3429 domain-containing protein [Gemmatimonas sp.]|jgi:hypothetical protein|uniref:DUF3429 domain-containing protein n=1 Tax=Gemmatimonas sp. TaxID=1962908 RepID=UPI00391F5825|nr:DUF3429 domain-containing protein [Gemmatimonadota bacterium]